MKENLTVIEIRIKFLRELKGLKQWELAKELGVSRSVINSWENGYANISLRKLVKLSYYFQVPIDYILGLITEFNKNDYNFRNNLDLKYLGRNIRIIRIISGLNQKEFAEKIKTKPSSISYYECGKMSMSSADLKDICNTFGFSADWCVGNTLECIRRDIKIKVKPEEIRTFLNI